MLDAIYEYELTPKSFSNMRTLVYGIFKLAKKKRLIDFSVTSVVQDMDISRKAFRRKVEDPEKEVFSTEELPIVMDYLMEHKDIVNLGLLLIFTSGLRVGELASLKNSDINFRSGIIHVCRTEIRYEDGKQAVYEVRDFPKTEAGIRDVILPTNFVWILKEIRSINPFGEYLFERKGERIRTYVFRDRLCYICKKLGIVRKTPHKARKTYGTMLLDGGVEESLIISQMGHTDIRTTKKHYYKDRLSKDEKRADIDRVIGF
ncbi:MAG: site-specific integrase [Lachnospiraceae bacterium]|nr:site-specific integrase [Lachnospiraceae bacterium]